MLHSINGNVQNRNKPVQAQPSKQVDASLLTAPTSTASTDAIESINSSSDLGHTLLNGLLSSELVGEFTHNPSKWGANEAACNRFIKTFAKAFANAISIGQSTNESGTMYRIQFSRGKFATAFGSEGLHSTARRRLITARKPLIDLLEGHPDLSMNVLVRDGKVVSTNVALNDWHQKKDTLCLFVKKFFKDMVGG